MESIHIPHNAAALAPNILRMASPFSAGVDVLALLPKRTLYDCVIILIPSLIILNACLKIPTNIPMIPSIIVEMSVLSVLMMEEHTFPKLVICDHTYSFTLLNRIENALLNDSALTPSLNP